MNRIPFVKAMEARARNTVKAAHQARKGRESVKRRFAIRQKIVVRSFAKATTIV
jgi:hypothetical protein